MDKQHRFKPTFGSVRAAHELTLTFQKIGAPNLRTFLMFFRKAVGWTSAMSGSGTKQRIACSHDPSETRVTGVHRDQYGSTTIVGPLPIWS